MLRSPGVAKVKVGVNDVLEVYVDKVLPPKLMLVAVATPSVGVVRVGLVEPTKLPEPLVPESPTPTEFTVDINISF